MSIASCNGRTIFNDFIFDAEKRFLTYLELQSTFFFLRFKIQLIRCLRIYDLSKPTVLYKVFCFVFLLHQDMSICSDFRCF